MENTYLHRRKGASLRPAQNVVASVAALVSDDPRLTAMIGETSIVNLLVPLPPAIPTKRLAGTLSCSYGA